MFKKTFFQIIIASLYIAAGALPALAVSDIIKDNADATGVEKTGTWSNTSLPSNKYASNYYYATSNGTLATIKYRPAFVQSGEYQLYQWLPQAGSNRTTNAQYKIQNASTLNTVTINQQVAGGSWVLVGNYMFSYGSQGYVEINDTNNGTYTNADAFKWVYVGPSSVEDLSAPTLTATSAQSGEALLSWTNVSGATGYKIFWGTSPSNMPNAIDITNASQRTHIVPGLTNGTTYHFKIYAYDAGRQSQDSTTVSVIPSNGSFNSHDILVDNPSAEVSGTWSNQTIGNKYATNYSRSTNSSGSGYLRYRPNFTDAGQYDVFYWLPDGSTSRGTNVPFATTHYSGTTTGTVNEQLTGGVWKWLGRYGFNSGTSGFTEISNVNNGTYTNADGMRFIYAGVLPPGIPQSVEANAGNQAVQVSWNTVSGADGYKVKYGTSPGVYSSEIITSSTSAIAENLTNGTTYYFAVKAYNSAGDGSLSVEVQATPNQVNAGATLFVSNVTYNASGQMTQVDYGNGNVTTHTYNTMQRLTKIKTVNATSQTIQDLNYTYDAIGNILSITDNVNTADQTFQYDSLNRLTQAIGQLYETKNYAYDSIGNITSKDGLTYTYDGIAGGPHAVTNLSDGTTFTYDDNGNMATMQKSPDLTEYFYDSENHLTQVKKNSQIVENYQYDGDGGRTKKVPYGSTPSTKFIGQMYEEQGIRSTAYVFLGDQRIASITNGAVLYFHGDHLGSANLVTSPTGVVKELSEYEPYGKFSKREKYGSPSEEAWYYFTNQYLDEATDLYYYGARYYSPLIGKFITPDDVVQNPTDPQTLNRYSYVSNNPINRVDPSGHSWKSFWKGFKKVLSFATGGLLGRPYVEAAFNGNWAMVGKGIMNLAGIMSGNPMLIISSGLSILGDNAAYYGYNKAARTLGYASMAVAAAYVAWNVGVGIKDWAVGKLNVTDLAGNSATLQSGDNVFVNGINTTLEGATTKAAELNNVYNAGISKIAHNQTNGLIADFTESFLQKVTFTSSVDRQLANMVKGLNNVVLTGHSQGSMIIGNTLLNLGFRDARTSVVDAQFFSTPLSQPRAYISAAIGGTGQRPLYSNNWGDPINLTGPNINPVKFVSGAMLQVQNH